MFNVCRGLSYVRIVSPKFDANGSVLSPFLVRRGQLVDLGQRGGVARCRCAPLSHERLGGLLVYVVCVEKCGVPLMCSAC